MAKRQKLIIENFVMKKIVEVGVVSTRNVKKRFNKYASLLLYLASAQSNALQFFNQNKFHIFFCTTCKIRLIRLQILYNNNKSQGFIV